MAARRSASIVACGNAASPSAHASARGSACAGGHDLGHQAHGMGLGGVDETAGEDQVQRSAEADDARQALGAAVDRAARPSAVRGIRAWRSPSAMRRSHHSASSRPPARHQPSIAAIVGLDGVRRVKPSGPSAPASRGANDVDVLEVGARAERDAAGTGEDQTRASSSASKRS